MLASNALIDFPFVQSLTNTQVGAQAQVEAIINIVSTEMENYTHRKLASQALNEFYTYTDNRFLIQPTLNINPTQSMPYNAFYKPLSLNNYPIIGTPTVYMDSTQQWGTGTQVSTFTLDSDMGILWFPPGQCIPTQPLSIKVSYTAGYSPVPSDLQAAALESVIWYVKRINSNSAGNKDSNKDGVSISYEIGLPIHVLKILNHYKEAC
jgi:hypothetical protein